MRKRLFLVLIVALAVLSLRPSEGRAATICDLYGCPGFDALPGEVWRIDYPTTFVSEFCNQPGCTFTTTFYYMRYPSPTQPGFPVQKVGQTLQCGFADGPFPGSTPNACNFIGDTEGNGDLAVVYSILTGFNMPMRVYAMAMMRGVSGFTALDRTIPLPGTLPLLALGIAGIFFTCTKSSRRSAWCVLRSR